MPLLDKPPLPNTPVVEPSFHREPLRLNAVEMRLLVEEGAAKGFSK